MLLSPDFLINSPRAAAEPIYHRIVLIYLSCRWCLWSHTWSNHTAPSKNPQKQLASVTQRSSEQTLQVYSGGLDPMLCNGTSCEPGQIWPNILKMLTVLQGNTRRQIKVMCGEREGREGGGHWGIDRKCIWKRCSPFLSQGRYVSQSTIAKLQRSTMLQRLTPAHIFRSPARLQDTQRL